MAGRGLVPRHRPPREPPRHRAAPQPHRRAPLRQRLLRGTQRPPDGPRRRLALGRGLATGQGEAQRARMRPGPLPPAPLCRGTPKGRAGRVRSHRAAGGARAIPSGHRHHLCQCCRRRLGSRHGLAIGCGRWQGRGRRGHPFCGAPRGARGARVLLGDHALHRRAASQLGGASLVHLSRF